MGESEATRHRSLRFHNLRHTYAALMVAAGAHPKLLQTQMGHASIRVTLDLYGHLYPDAFTPVGKELDRLVSDHSRERAVGDMWGSPPAIPKPPT